MARILAACGCCHHRGAASAAVIATGDLVGSAALAAAREADGAGGTGGAVLAESVLQSGQVICAGVIGTQ